ncbi:hypothetical protein [Cytobacillus pseudoceanisediminis]
MKENPEGIFSRTERLPFSILRAKKNKKTNGGQKMTTLKKQEFEIKVLQNRNGKGFYFTDPYFYTLALLGVDGPFTQQQLLDIYKIYGDMATDKSWSKKVVKMSDLKFVSQKNINIRKRDGMQFNFVEITENGMDFLKETGFVNKAAKIRNNSTGDHTIGIRQVLVDVLNVIAENKELGGKYVTQNTIFPISKYDTTEKPLNVYRFYQDEKLGVNDNIRFFNKTKEEIVSAKANFVTSLNSYATSNFKDIGLFPDWVFQFKKNLFHVEVDSGKQSFEKKSETADVVGEAKQTTIKQKVEKYFEIAEKLPNHKHHAVFVLLDDSVTTKKYFGNRTTRIRNLKDGIGELLIKDAPANLKVSVISLERAKDFFSTYFLSVLETEKEDLKRLNAAINFMNRSSMYPYDMKIIKKDNMKDWDVEVNKDIMKTPFLISSFYKNLKLKEEQKKLSLVHHNIVPIMVKEGDVLTYAKINHYSKMFREQVFKKTKLLLIYDTKKNMEQDVLHTVPKRNKLENLIYQKVLLMPFDEWEKSNHNFYGIDQKAISASDLLDFLDKE